MRALAHASGAEKLWQAGVGMGLDRISDQKGRHNVLVANIVKDNSVMRDGRIQVGDRITHIDDKAIEVSRQRI